MPLALIGLCISLYILLHKLQHKKLVCIIGEDCNEVVKSKYGYMLGIPNEAMGVLYYLFMLGAMILLLSGFDQVFGISLLFLVRIGAGFALLVSVYLALIQLLKLKKWCEYCLATALTNLIIFFLVIR